MVRPWLLLLMAACASPGAEYQRGAAVVRPIAPARPGIGAPTYDPRAQPLPPQPNPRPRRVLPQTQETRRGPGIWASDGPRNSPATAPAILTEIIPLPAPEDADAPMVRECSDVFGFALADRPILAARFMGLPPLRRECVALRRFHECMSHGDAPDTKRIAAFVARRIHERCPPLTDAEEDIASDMLVAVVKYIESGGGSNGPRH